MSGEKEFFRKRFFGGFNRDDVIKYITRIADERNEAVAARQKALKEIQTLKDELSTAVAARENAEKDARTLAEEVKTLRYEAERRVEVPEPQELKEVTYITGSYNTPEVPDLSDTPEVPEEPDLPEEQNHSDVPEPEPTVKRVKIKRRRQV